jgi:hypothetical protein
MECTMQLDDDRWEGSFNDPQFDDPGFVSPDSRLNGHPTATPSNEVREAVLGFDADLRLRPERISTKLAERGIDAPVDQVRGALAGL